MYIYNSYKELQKQREIAQLKKEDRRKENMIKELKADKLRKDAVLRRRQEEVSNWCGAATSYYIQGCIYSS